MGRFAGNCRSFAATRSAPISVFSDVIVSLVPLIFAMQFEPPASGVPPLLAVVGQLKWGLAGLVTSVLALGWILGRFIPRGSRSPAVAGAGRKNGEA